MSDHVRPAPARQRARPRSAIQVILLPVKKALRVLFVIAAAMSPGIPPPPPPPPQTMEQHQVDGQHDEQP